MTGTTRADRAIREGRETREGLALRPAEGWLSVLALLVMLIDLGVAVDEVHWAGWVAATGQSQTWFLPMALVLGAAWGLLAAKLRWHALLAHAVGGVLGALFAIWVVAATIPAVLGVTIPAVDPYRLGNLVASIQLFSQDVFVDQVRSGQTSAFLLVVAAVGWASGSFAAYAIYRHHRPMSAVLFLGLLLLASMSLTTQHGQYPFLIVYAAAALFLLVRLSLAEQRALWANVRLGDAGAAFSLYLRNGVTFIVVALLGAVVLTANASSAPLRPYVVSSADQFYSWASQFDRFASGIVAPVRGPSGLFTESQTIQGIWTSSPELIYEVQTSDGNGYYWQGATYNQFDGRTWTQTARTVGTTVPAGQPALAGSVDQAAPGSAYRAVQVTVTPVNTVDQTILSAGTPYAVSAPTRVVTQGAGGPLDEISLASVLPAGGSYRVTALVRDGAKTPVTANELAAAGVDYPGWAKQYVSILPGSIGPIVREETDRIVATLPAGEHDPYHVAKAIQDWLYSGGHFIYDTNVQGDCAPGMPVPDCLLTSKRGYCEYFATTMVMMLRTQEIPARYVVGYLPGHPNIDGVFQVDAAAAHAWVEVYFPHYGWIRFDPTPGNVGNGQQPTNLPAGPPVPSPKPSASPKAGSSAGPGASANPGPARPRFGQDLNGGGSTSSRSGQGSGPIGLIAAILVLAAGVALFARLRFAPPPSPAAAYTGIARLAARFGYAPRPAQTPYEYATMLGDVLPGARPDLEVVAQARVEAVYGRRALGVDQRAALRRAYGRLRLRLLGLVVRYRRRR